MEVNTEKENNEILNLLPENKSLEVFLIKMRIEIKNNGPFSKEIKPENGIFELTKSQIVKGNYLDIYFNNKRLIVKL